MKKGFLICMVICCMLINSATAAIMPTIFSRSIDFATGEVPIDVTINVTTTSNVNNIKIIDSYGTVLLGAESVYTSNDGKKNFSLKISIVDAFAGDLQLMLNTGGRWIPSNERFTVDFHAPKVRYPVVSHPPFTPPQSEIRKLNKGDTITFGSYIRNRHSEPLSWLVLDVKPGQNRALLITKEVIEMRRFHSRWSNVSWRDCALRAWLNEDFYYTCFSPSEQRAIMKSEIRSTYVDTTITTLDYVFALNKTEADKYFHSNSARKGTPTQHSIHNEIAVVNGHSYWWLRDSSSRKNDANRVKPDGTIETYGGNTNAYGVGVRPAIWVELSTFKH